MGAAFQPRFVSFKIQKNWKIKMFIIFFYSLRNAGIPVTPTSFLTLQKALNTGLICSLDEFYTSARAVLIKSERYFDIYDRVFAHCFHDIEFYNVENIELSEAIKAMLEQWLKDPSTRVADLDIDGFELNGLTPEELIEYFKRRLEDQKKGIKGVIHG